MKSFSFVALLKGEGDAGKAFPQWLKEATGAVLVAKEMELSTAATLVAVRGIPGGELRRGEALSAIHREQERRRKSRLS